MPSIAIYSPVGFPWSIFLSCLPAFCLSCFAVWISALISYRACLDVFRVTDRAFLKRLLLAAVNQSSELFHSAALRAAGCACLRLPRAWRTELS